MIVFIIKWHYRHQRHPSWQLRCESQWHALAILLLASFAFPDTLRSLTAAALNISLHFLPYLPPDTPITPITPITTITIITTDDDIVIRDDHVQAGEGLEKVDLAFEGLMLSLDLGKKKGESEPTERLLLDGSIRGRAQPGRMLAIMGPSGAGKSTLLHALAGRVKHNPKLQLTGQRYMNGVPVDGASMIPSAFIQQEVSFFPHMTVRETLDFRVELKLGARLSKHARDTMVRDLIQQLGLSSASDTIVGNQKVRGISGGERKRLSIAVEMISAPSVIFLDEPTSGLDSTAAFTLIQTLRELADAGKTVVAVIHQPSQHVFAKFDDLMLLSEGKQMYSGELNSARQYMEDQGYSAPNEMGTAEHILDCVSRAPFENETQEQADERVEALAAVARAAKIDLGKHTVDKAKMVRHRGIMAGGAPQSSMFTQFRLLLTRSFREITRGKATLAVKTVQQITLGLIYGGIYSLGTNQSSIQDRFGLLSLIAIGSANTAVAGTSRAFVREKSIVQEELTSKMYRTLPYFIGKAVSMFPMTGLFSSLFGGILYFLTGLSNAPGKFQTFMTLLFTHWVTCESAGLVIGAISPNSDVALSIFPALMVLNIIFDGKNISEENTPYLLRWIPKVGLIRWGFEGVSCAVPC
jgi:ABC-type multidrug transport system ATPase subunit